LDLYSLLLYKQVEGKGGGAVFDLCSVDQTGIHTTSSCFV